MSLGYTNEKISCVKEKKKHSMALNISLDLGLIDFKGDEKTRILIETIKSHYVFLTHKIERSTFDSICQ